MSIAQQDESIFTPYDINDVVVYPLKKFYDDRGWLAELLPLHGVPFI